MTGDITEFNNPDSWHLSPKKINLFVKIQKKGHFTAVSMSRQHETRLTTILNRFWTTWFQRA